MLTNILEKQGFSPLEARVYLATLELGQAPASRIATKLNENRVTVYSALEAMKKRDLVLTVVKNKVVHYSAISPKSLLKNMQEKADSFAEAMPEFLALSTLFDSDKPSVQFYEGVEGLKMVYEDTVSEFGSTIKSYLWYGKIEKNLKRWLDYVYLPLRIKHKVVAEVLLPAKIKALPGYAPSDKKDPVSKLTKLQFVENPIFDTTNEIVLYGGNKIAIVMFEESEMMGLVIKSKTLYATLSALFDLTRERETNA